MSLAMATERHTVRRQIELLVFSPTKFNSYTIGAMRITSAQSQLKLSCLRSNYFKIKAELGAPQQENLADDFRAGSNVW
jgi:hypothetical protein